MKNIKREGMEVKRIISLILAIAMLFSFAACGKNQTIKPEDEVKDNSQVIEPPEENSGQIEITPVVTNEYTVTFYYNYGNNDVYKTVSVESGKTVDAPEDPERAGYSFDGWYTEKEDGEKFDFESIITEDVDLYARWNKNSETSTEAVSTHTVTFYYNYGDNDVYKTVKVESGKTVDKPEDPERTKYSFEGWYTAKENGKKFNFDTAITESISLYAHWEKKSIWDYIIGGGSGEDDEEEKPGNEKVDDLSYTELNPNDVITDIETGITFAKGQIDLVTKKNIGYDKVEELVLPYGGVIIGHIGISNDYQILFEHIDMLTELQEICTELNRNDIVEFAIVNYVEQLDDCIMPFDNAWKNESWNDYMHADGLNWNIEASNIAKAWELIDTIDEIIKVGIYDSSFDESYNEIDIETFNNDSTKSINIDSDSFHGTTIAELISAEWNAEGIAGIAPDSDLYGFSITGDNDTDYTKLETTYGIKYAIATLVKQNCKVINVSQCQYQRLDVTDNVLTRVGYGEKIDTTTQTLTLFINEMEANGYDFLIVQGAGNASNKNKSEKRGDGYTLITGWQDAYWSGMFNSITDKNARKHVIVVSAFSLSNDLNKDNRFDEVYAVSDFSQIGDFVDIVAPGQNIYVNHLNTAAMVSGTSYAAPHVSATASLIWSVNPSLKASEVKNVIINASSDRILEVDTSTIRKTDYAQNKTKDDMVKNKVFYYPMLNTCGAVASALGYKIVSCHITDDLTNSAIKNAKVTLYSDSVVNPIEKTFYTDSKGYVEEYIDIATNLNKAKIEADGYIAKVVGIKYSYDNKGYILGEIELVPNQDYSISGKVTDGTSALSSVTVAIASTTDPAAQFAPATTTADGTYSFSVPNGTYTLTFTKDKYQTQTKTGVVVNGSDVTVPTVVMPLAETTFTITHGTENILAMGSVEMYNGIGYQTWIINSSEPWRISTNDGDWFTLSVGEKTVGLNSTFDPGTTELKLNITRYTDSRNNGTLAFTAGDKTYTVEIFQKAYSITGTVVAGGAPASGAKVIVSNEYYTSAELTTGADGKFTVAVPNGWYSVTVTAEGYKPVTLEGSVEMKGANVDIGEILLEEAITISLTGTVRDGDENSPTYGKALEGVSFEVFDSAGKKVGDTVKSNENGIVAFDFPAIGTYKFVFSLIGYETVTVDAVIINENTPSIGTYVMMRSEYTTAVSGTTSPGTKLELLDENGKVIAETVADENGNYEFKDIPGWDGTIFRIRIKDTTITVDVVGGATGVVVDATITIFTVSKPDVVEIGNEVGATSEWEIESSHQWTVTAAGDTSWFTLSSTSGECGITKFTVTANSATDVYRESVLTFALNNKTFEVTIYQDIDRTTVSGTTTPGTKLELLDENGNVIAETVADENGYYEFKDIPGWDGTVFIIRIKDTTLTTEVVGGETDVVIDTTITIFTISVPDIVEIKNEVGAISEWETTISHPWTVTKSGDTSWYTLSAESGSAGTFDLVVTANGATDSYRESTLTFALNNRTFDVKIYQDFVQTVSGSVVERTENSAEAGIEGVQLVVRKAGASLQYLKTETDANGQYTLIFEDAGEYEITAEKSGYTTATVDFSVSSETTEIEKITLTKTVSPYYFNGHTYLLIFPNKSYTTWEEAEAICQSLGGHLVSINSEAENDFVKALAENGFSYGMTTFTPEWCWIGAHRENGNWVWSDGEPFGSYTNWSDGLESVGLYGMMYSVPNKSYSGSWERIRNNRTQYAGIVCEWGYEVESIEGVFNNDFTWQFTIDGTLTISGQGVLANADYNTAPWRNLEYNIVKVELTRGITEIGEYGLRSTSHATEVILPDTLNAISEYSSYLDSYYRKNYTVSADNMVYTSVDGVLFTKDMTTLIEYPQSNERTEYSIPDGVKVIENLNGNNLGIINIPASVSEWNLRYEDFNSMKGFNVDPDNTVFSSIDGVLFNKAGDTLVKYPSAKPVEANIYRIPDGVTTIEDGAFYSITITDWNNHAVGIIFPASVTTIGYDNFFFEDRYHTHTNLYFEGNAPLVDGYYGGSTNSGDGMLEYTTIYYTSGKSGWTSPSWYLSYKDWNNETKLINICIPTVLQDAYATVSGQVVDENGYPLENVKIQGKFGDEFTGIAYTDYYGEYTFQFESATTCDFRYYLDGYETVFVDAVDITEGEYSLDTVTMSPGVSLLGSGKTGGGNNWTLIADELVITCGENNSSGIYYLSSYRNEPIQEYSFWSPNDMMQIRKINIGEGITTLRISDIDMENNLSVEELYIGADVCKIEWWGNSFINDYRHGDTDIVTDPANSDYVITDGALYTSDYKTLVLAPQNDYSATTYNIREGVEVVGEYAFSNACYETINIPDTVSVLKSLSFAYSYYLESIHIPSSVTSIDGNVFCGCDNLSIITVDAANAEYMAEDNILYNKAQTMLIAVPSTLTGSFTIPDGITYIADYAMDDTMLDRIIIPASVTSINHYSIATHYSNTTCKIYFLGDVPETVSYYAFGHYFEGMLYYLEGASGWSTPTTEINGMVYKTQPFTIDELN